jgi:hypothetical protein
VSSAPTPDLPDVPSAPIPDAQPEPAPTLSSSPPPAALGAYPADSTRRQRELLDLKVQARAGDRQALIKFLRARRAG